MKLTKIVNYLGWASGIFGGLMMLAGVVGFLSGGEFLGVKYYIHFFFFSMPFILLGIFFLVGTRSCCCCCKDDKCCSEEGKEK
jgi:hypothetical protein